MIRLFLVLFVVSLSFRPAMAQEADIWGATVPSSFILYIVAPDRIAGWPAKLYAYETRYIPEKYRKLPILGSWHGGGGIPDKEMLLKMKVKKAFIFSATPLHSTDMMYEEIRKLGIEVFLMESTTVQEDIALFKKLGEILEVPERGLELALYGEEALARTLKIIEAGSEKHPRVYLAGKNGLSSVCNSRLLDLTGAENVYKCEGTNETFRQLDFEQIMGFDPDVVLITDPNFASEYHKDPKWKTLRAYREGRFYVVPHGPFGWMDKPSQAMQFIGMQWLACTLYPERCNIDMLTETKKFIKLFMHTEMTDKEVAAILTGA